MGCYYLAILACLLMMRTPAAQAQTAPGIEQTFSGSLTAMPSEILGVSGAFYVPVYSSVSISQGKGAGGFLGDAEHPQCFGDTPTCLATDRIFRHQWENGGKLPQGAGGAETVLDH
jgi:hypothetical protein